MMDNNSVLDEKRVLDGMKFVVVVALSSRSIKAGGAES